MKTVLITGASRGIGRATALEFAKNGWQVAVNYNKSETAAKELCDEIAGLGGCAKVYQADVSDCDAVCRMINQVAAEFGDIDVLVNNAGIALTQGLFTDFADSDARRIFDTNVFGMMNCTRAIVPHFVNKKSGKIINLSSVWGIAGGSCEVIYSASKAAVIGFTKALAKELAPSGICVNCVAPGFIDTDMNAHLSKADIEAFCEDVPLGRIGKAQEVAESICFLASEDASYITGQVLSVDGGLV
ncbi:MAG: glucose 1-dehydrogenase [Ruminococcaceae bacterium]|nr:glucose 1-dehydrogenase [Oscillospiraceae bacterium]